jgi:hypothetical protein
MADELHRPAHVATAAYGEPTLAGDHTVATVTDDISDAVLKRPIEPKWILGLLLSFGLLNVLMKAIA